MFSPNVRIRSSRSRTRCHRWLSSGRTTNIAHNTTYTCVYCVLLNDTRWIYDYYQLCYDFCSACFTSHHINVYPQFVLGNILIFSISARTKKNLEKYNRLIIYYSFTRPFIFMLYVYFDFFLIVFAIRDPNVMCVLLVLIFYISFYTAWFDALTFSFIFWNK